MPELEQIVATYADREDRGRAESAGSAAVAMVLREGPQGVEALFIERARRDGDPWSGQMAFPGGRWETVDGSLRETAARETFEELSVDLSDSPYLGYLGEVTRRRASRAGFRLSLPLAGPRASAAAERRGRRCTVASPERAS